MSWLFAFTGASFTVSGVSATGLVLLKNSALIPPSSSGTWIGVIGSGTLIGSVSFSGNSRLVGVLFSSRMISGGIYLITLKTVSFIAGKYLSSPLYLAETT